MLDASNLLALDVDSLAQLPARGPWAVRVLAGAMAGQVDGELESSWSGAPPTVAMLAAAVARAGDAWRLFRPSGRRYDTEWALVLAPDRPCPQVAKARSFELAIGEDGLGYAVSWTDQDDAAPVVHWFDAEDGSSRREGTLESWCAGLVLDSLFAEQDGERNPDGIFLEAEARDRLATFLRVLARRRAELGVELRREAARLEAEIERIEAADGDADAAYEALDDVSGRLDSLGARGPWPSPEQ